MKGFREESEERVVHRLEAFSDIVIGFSLAQMTLSLKLPADPLRLFTTDYVSLLGFGLTFLIVSGMWWQHHRLFAHYFVPTAPAIVLNFLSLAGILFLVYTLQVWLHASAHKWVAYTMYTGSIAWVLGLNAILTYSGVAMRGKHMPAQLVARGRQRAMGQGILAVAFGVSTALDVRSQKFGGRESSMALLILVIVFGAVRITQGWRDRKSTQARVDTRSA